LAVHYSEIKEAGADVLLVSFYPPDRTRNWARRYGIEFRTGSDETRETYFHYGLGDTKMSDLLGPQSWLAGLKAFVGTRTIPSYAQHYKQTGGYFVVDAEGTIHYAHPSKGPADHPPIDELLAILGVEHQQG
jgi:hypothetical protein